MNENPFENHPELFEQVFKAKHKCPTVEIYNKDTNCNIEYLTDELCVNGCCEYCCGNRYNEWFATKPSDEAVRSLVLKMRIKSDMATKHNKKAYNKLLATAGDEGQLVTLCIDKKYQKIPDLFLEIKSRIQEANYSCLCDAYIVLEVYGKDNNFNPHIHIITRKIKANSAVAQLLRRKFQNDKYQIYRVDVAARPYTCIDQYIQGDKQANKLGATAKDKEYREANNLMHVYKL